MHPCIPSPPGLRIPRALIQVYGIVDGQSTEAGAIGTILRSLHGRYGDKPQVGKPFKVTDSDSAAVFFTLTKRNQDGSAIAGLVIASQTAPASAALPLKPYVLSDRSASVSLPSGWKVEPSSGGGTILARGPDNEEVALDYPCSP